MKLFEILGYVISVVLLCSSCLGHSISEVVGEKDILTHIIKNVPRIFEDPFGNRPDFDTLFVGKFYNGIDGSRLEDIIEPADRKLLRRIHEYNSEEIVLLDSGVNFSIPIVYFDPDQSMKYPSLLLSKPLVNGSNIYIEVVICKGKRSILGYYLKMVRDNNGWKIVEKVQSILS